MFFVEVVVQMDGVDRGFKPDQIRQVQAFDELAAFLPAEQDDIISGVRQF